MSKSKRLTIRIVIGMALGMIFGLLMNLFHISGFLESFVLDGVIEVGGRVFISSLKLLVVPMVFVSLICGTGSLDDMKKLGRMGIKTFLLYVLTTAAAIIFAIIAAVIIDPGAGFEMHADALSSFSAGDAPPLIDVISNIFPSNPVESMAKGDMLQIIVFAILFGIGMTLAGEPGKRVFNIFEDLNEVIMKMVMFLIEFAPIGVFCLITQVFAKQGLEAILPMAKYFFTVLLVLIFHATVSYGFLLKFLGRLNPIPFYKKFRKVMLFAFSTASSNATIPVNLETCEKDLGIHNKIASFTIPLGATINMDGTAIMQGVATVFVATVYGIPLGITEYLMVILTATLASIGTAGVPGVGLIMLAMVFKQVGLPIEGIGLIIGVDRLLDMVRTSVNITGDAVVSCIVAKSEGELNEETYFS